MTDAIAKNTDNGHDSDTTDDNTTQQAPDNAKIDALAHKIRHIGYTFCVILAVALAGFLISQIVIGMQNNTVYDPFTNEIIKT